MNRLAVVGITLPYLCDNFILPLWRFFSSSSVSRQSALRLILLKKSPGTLRRVEADGRRTAFPP